MNASALLRSLLTYALIVPLALLMGYMLTQITQNRDAAGLWIVGGLSVLLIFPLLIRWHYPLLLLFWSANILLFFIPGSPNICLLMIAVSLGFSVIEHILKPDKRFIRVPIISWALIALAVVAFITAKLTGGIGLHSFGSNVYNGRKYIFLFIGIAGYFALTARPIPPEKAKLFAALYFLGMAFSFIGDLYPLMPSWSYILFCIFPPSGEAIRYGFEPGHTRLAGVGNAASGLYLLMLAIYGLRGIFLSRKPWRPVLLFGLLVVAFLGGYRTTIFLCGLTFMFMFFAERLYRTRMLIIFILIGCLGAMLLVPFAHKLPFTFQRALAFLPLNLDRTAKAAADASTNWRIQMWTALLPQIPDHILLGKGYALSVQDFSMIGNHSAFRTVDAASQELALAGDFHNGMISLILGFGIWGVLAGLWLMFAGLWVLYRNLKYGRPELFTINAMLFILFFNEVASYISCFGGMGISSDIYLFVGPLGLSIALNHGVCRRPVREAVVAPGQQRLLPPVPMLQH